MLTKLSVSQLLQNSSLFAVDDKVSVGNKESQLAFECGGFLCERTKNRQLISNFRVGC